MNGRQLNIIIDAIQIELDEGNELSAIFPDMLYWSINCRNDGEPVEERVEVLYADCRAVLKMQQDMDSFYRQLDGDIGNIDKELARMSHNIEAVNKGLNTI